MTPKSVRVIMTTYFPKEADDPRFEMALKCLASLRNGIGPLPIPLTFHISDDGSDPSYFGKLIDLADAPHKMGWKGAVVTRTERRGIGGSLNQALRHVKGDELWLYTTDDWILTSPLDLTQAINLIVHEGYDYVRLGPIHPNLCAWTRFNQQCGWWLQLDRAGGGFCFATRPFIATRAFYETIGAFKEQCDAYECEIDYNNRLAFHPHLKIGQIGTIPLHGPWDNLDMDENHQVGRIIEPSWQGGV